MKARRLEEATMTMRFSLTRFGAVAIFVALSGLAPTHAQTPPSPIPGVEPALLDDIVAGSRILADLGVVDAFGHVSARQPTNPNRFLMSRSLAPALVTSGDVMEFDLDGNAIDAGGRAVFLERFIHGEIYKARPDVMSVIHSHSQAVIPLSLTAIKMKPVIAQAGFLPPVTPTFEIRDARKDGERGMQVTNSVRGAALARTLSSYPVALMRGHGEVVVGASVKQAVVYAAYVDINARMQTQALLLSRDIVTMNQPELFTPEEFDINRPWEHLKQKTLDDAAKAKVDRAQFGLDQTQTKR